MPTLPFTTLLALLRDALEGAPPAVRRRALRALRRPRRSAPRPPPASLLTRAEEVLRVLRAAGALVPRVQLVHVLGVRGRDVQRALSVLIRDGLVVEHPPSGAHARPRYAAMPRPGGGRP